MIKRYLLIIAGIISLLLGIIGIFLPILPTTPFVLLAAACFLKSSKRLYTWLINHKLLGPYISNYLKYRAVTIKSKTIAIIFLWLTILCSVIFFVKLPLLKLLLLVIATIVTIHILSLKTLTKKMLDRNMQADT